MTEKIPWYVHQPGHHKEGEFEKIIPGGLWSIKSRFSDAEDVAEQWAEEMVDSDPEWYSYFERGITLLVKSPEEIITTVEVSAEATIVYHASEKEEVNP